MDTAGRSKRILILDDEPGILELLEDYLRSLDFDPVATSLWTEAVDVIGKSPPDLVLLDLNMPTVQGDAVLEFVRSQGHHLPVVVVSAHLNQQSIEKLRRLGAAEFVSKPFRLNDLVETIQRALEIPQPALAGATAVTQGSGRQVMTPPLGPARIPPPPVEQAETVYTALDQDVAELAVAGTATVPQVQVQHHHHHRARKKGNFGIYVVISIVCIVGSLVILLLEKIPAYMSKTLEKAVEKSMEAEATRGKEAIRNMSDSQKESFEKAMRRKP